MIPHRRQDAQRIAQKWGDAQCDRTRRAQGVRCGWALGTGAHPAVDKKLGDLARRARARPNERADAARRAFLLAEVDVVAAIAQHLGLEVERVTWERGADDAVSIRLRGAPGAITVMVKALDRETAPSLWIVRGARLTAEAAGPIAELAPSWARVVFDAGAGQVELRAHRAKRHPSAWTQTVGRAWRARLDEGEGA